MGLILQKVYNTTKARRQNSHLRAANAVAEGAALATAFELDFWGRLRRAEEGARAQLLQAEEGRRVVGLAVGASVVRAYAWLRAAEVRAAAATEILAARDVRRSTPLGASS